MYSVKEVFHLMRYFFLIWEQSKIEPITYFYYFLSLYVLFEFVMNNKLKEILY